MAKIGVSILSEINNNYLMTISEVIKNGIKWIHYDIMDGKFVPNKSFTIQQIMECIEKNERHYVDLHLMVNDPEYFLDHLGKFADLIVFHHEAVDYDYGKDLIKMFQDLPNKPKVGIAINPGTNPEQIYEYLPLVDYLLVMSVHPGKGGQQFIPESLTKINHLRKYIDNNKLRVEIGIDGGVNGENAKLIVRAGADTLISGSYITKNVTKSIREIKREIK